MTTGGNSNKEYTVKENKFYLKCKQKISKNRQKIKQKNKNGSPALWRNCDKTKTKLKIFL